MRPGWIGDLEDFEQQMLIRIHKNIERKGTSWKDCDPEYLKAKLLEHLGLGHYADVANYCFMLWDQEQIAKIKTVGGKET